MHLRRWRRAARGRRSEEHTSDLHDALPIFGAVSRKHCQIVREGNQYYLEDLGSRNGTFLNDESDKVDGRRQLRLGDVLRVCEVSFTFGTDAPQAMEAGGTGPEIGRAHV